MTDSDGTIRTSGCLRDPEPAASQTDSPIETSHDAEVARTRAISVPMGPSQLTTPSIAAAEGGYMNGKRRPVSGRG